MGFSFDLLINAVIAGILLGGFYAAVTLGVSISFGILDIVNIAHPAFIILGSYIAYIVNDRMGIDPIAVSVLVSPLFFALGMLLYRIYYLCFEKRGQESLRGLAFFFGILFITEVALVLIFGVDYRLVQTAYHNRSLVLYTRLGFATREPLSVVKGSPLGINLPAYEVRPATAEDIAACNQICRQVHGFDRNAELAEAVRERRATIVEHLGRITGYATSIGFFAHAVAESNQHLKARIGAARSFAGPGFLLPTRNHDLFSWCLENRLQLLMQMTLMTTGLYNEPAGAYLPSILY